MNVDPTLNKIYYYSGDANAGSFIQIDGIENLNIQKQISFSEAFSLGSSALSTNINAPQEIKVSFERSFVQNDFLFSFTGSEPVKKLFAYNGDKYYEVSNLYLDSYSASFSVGSLPRIVTNFTAFGEDVCESLDLKFENQIKSTLSNIQFEIPNLNSISITGNFDKNIKDKYNIYQFDYNLSIKRQPFYSIGSTKPINVVQILPLDISVSIASKVPKKSNFPEMPEYYNIDNNYLNFNINVSGSSSNYLFSLPVRNGKLINSEIKMSSQDVLNLNRGIIGNYGL